MTADFPIWIPGIPRPQGSKSVNRRTGVMFEANPETRAWRASCARHLELWAGTYFGAWEPFDGPLLVDVTFVMPEPKRPSFAEPAVKPDLDKLQRALGDALTVAQIIKDDARITTWHARKRYGEPGVRIHDIRKDRTDGA